MSTKEQERSGRPRNILLHRDPRVRLLARPFSFGVAFTIFVFVIWEAVERTWFTGADDNTLHWIHLARGIFCSLCAAALVGWMVIRASPEFLTTPPAGGEWAQPLPLTEEQRMGVYARWFIAMRWIAALLAASLVFVSVQLLDWLPREAWWPLVFSVGALIGSNLCYMLWLQSQRAISALLHMQGYCDLVILTALLHFSGGIENPLSMMMIFHVIIGGILLTRRQCYGIAIAASSLITLLTWAEWAEVVKHYTLQIFPQPAPAAGELFHPAHNAVYATSFVFLQAAVLLLTAYFVTTLVNRLRYNDRQIVAMAERAVADRQLLERALETTGAGVRVLSHDLQSFWSSNRWNEWFVGPEGAICSGCVVLQRDDSPARRCLEDGRVRTTELVLDASNCPPQLRPSNNGQRIFQVTTAPLLDQEQKIVQVVELAQDITAQKKAQAQILQAGKLAAVGELAGEVAHEVNNPISIISAKARLLLSDHTNDMSPKVAQELAKISEQALRVARIAQGLLSYCRPSAATRTRLDLRVPVRKALAAIDEQARRGAVHLEDQLAEPLPLVKANPHELEQVFLNLFLNALDAMPKGGWLKVSRLPGEVLLSDGRPAVAIVVVDTGSGIPEEIRDKIFEPFFTTKKAGHGTGLGLSICLGIVRGHEGELAIDSKVWQGTRITIKLPIDAPLVREDDHHAY
jgi:signal transduction histidine kinase